MSSTILVMSMSVLFPIASWNLATIVHTFEICRASHVTKNSKYPIAKIIIFSDMKISVYVLSSPQNKYRQFEVQGCSNLGTCTSLILGHVTCPANFKRVDYSLAPIDNGSSSVKLLTSQ